MKFSLLFFILTMFLSNIAIASDKPGYSLEWGKPNLCNRTFDNYSIALKEISQEAEHYKSDENFIIYRDDKEKIIWNFTTESNPAHPSIVCQQLRRINGEVMMATEVVCNADKDTCDYLKEYYSEKSSLLMKKSNEKSKND